MDVLPHLPWCDCNVSPGHSSLHGRLSFWVGIALNSFFILAPTLGFQLAWAAVAWCCFHYIKLNRPYVVVSSLLVMHLPGVGAAYA